MVPHPVRVGDNKTLVGRLVNKVTNFSQLQSSVQGGKTQAYRSYVEFFQRSNGGCSEDKVLPYLSSGPLDTYRTGLRLCDFDLNQAIPADSVPDSRDRQVTVLYLYHVLLHLSSQLFDEQKH